jgi:hypothetical protein
MDNLIDNLLLCAAAVFFYWGIGLFVAAFNPPEDLAEKAGKDRG